jgi:hypothetical protein
MNDDMEMREDETRPRSETGEIDGGRMEERDDDTEEITEHSRTRTGAGE